MAQTIKDNWPLIEKNSSKVFIRKFVQDLGKVMLPPMDTYARLDNKDNSTHDPPTHDDILDALEVVNVNPEVEELMVTAFNAAGPVLMTSIQMLAVNALLHNVTNFAQETVRSSATEDFKAGTAERILCIKDIFPLARLVRPFSTLSHIAVVGYNDGHRTDSIMRYPVSQERQEILKERHDVRSDTMEIKRHTFITQNRLQDAHGE